MSTTAIAPPVGDSSDFDRIAFGLIVDGYDGEQPETPARSFRPSRAAERREGQQQIDEQLGLHRHRTNERRD